MKIYKVLILVILTGCSSPIEKIPIENIFSHRQFLEDRIENKKEDFKVYESLLKNDPELNKSPHIYYYLSRLEEDNKYLNLGLELFPFDPYLNFNKKNSLSSSEEIKLYEKILEKHPKHTLSFLNYINSFSDQYSQIFSQKEIFENSSLIRKLNNVVINYENGNPNSSKFYNLNSENHSITEFRKNFIEESIVKIKSLYQELSNLNEMCKGKENSLYTFDRNRIRRIPNMEFVGSTEVEYLEECKYVVSHNVMDNMYYSQYNFFITYLYENNGWTRLSSKSYKNIRGRWVLQD